MVTCKTLDLVHRKQIQTTIVRILLCDKKRFHYGNQEQQWLHSDFTHSSENEYTIQATSLIPQKCYQSQLKTSFKDVHQAER